MPAVNIVNVPKLARIFAGSVPAASDGAPQLVDVRGYATIYVICTGDNATASTDANIKVQAADSSGARIVASVVGSLNGGNGLNGAIASKAFHYDVRGCEFVYVIATNANATNAQNMTLDVAASVN